MKDKNRYEVKNPNQLSGRKVPWRPPMACWAIQPGNSGFALTLAILFLSQPWLLEGAGHWTWCSWPDPAVFLFGNAAKAAMAEPPGWDISLGSLPAGKEELLPMSTELIQSLSKGKGWVQRCINCWLCKPGEQTRCALRLVSASKATPPKERGFWKLCFQLLLSLLCAKSSAGKKLCLLFFHSQPRNGGVGCGDVFWWFSSLFDTLFVVIKCPLWKDH